MDPFVSFYTNPNLKLTDVFESQDLIPSIKSESLSLFNYLSQDSVITELAEWCITSKYIENPNYAKYSSTAVSIFLATSMNIFDFVLESCPFADILHQFLESNDSLNSKFCGHFSRILSTQIRWGTPALFVNYTDTQSLLLQRIQMSAIRDLIELIILTSAYEKLNTQEFITQLAIISSSNGENSQDSETCLIDIFSSLTPDSELFHIFCQPEFVNHMIQAAISSKSSCMAHDILKMIYSISKVAPQSIVLTEPQKKMLYINQNNITDLSISALPIFFMNQHLDISDAKIFSITNIFSLFFDEKSFPKLHNRLCSLIDELTPDQLNEVASIPNFLQFIIDSFGTPKWCPHMLKLSIIFTSIDKPGPNLRSKNWCQFIRQKFIPIYRILCSNYGGEIGDTRFVRYSKPQNAPGTDGSSKIPYWTGAE